MPDDFSEMQAQAIKFAREMQQKATPPKYSEHNININKNQAQHNQQIKHDFPPVNEIFGHRNPWSQERETPFCKSACPIKNIMGIGNKGGFGDNDTMLLMALLLLLSQDNGDKMLMLALLYIMT